MDDNKIFGENETPSGLHKGLKICLWTFGLGLALLVFAITKLRSDSYWVIVGFIDWVIFPLSIAAGLIGGIIGLACLSWKVNNMFWTPLALSLLNLILAGCAFFIRIGYIAIGRL